jgi:uncharacterized protein YcaQ
MSLKISPLAARNLMLMAQALHHKPNHKATKSDVLDTIRQMGQLQIDTIHVVARSPYLVLWSRLGDYKPQWLDELLAEGKLFEYWSHAACFLPIEDYPLYRRLMLDGGKRWSNQTQKWISENKETVDHVMKHIRERGETRSADFKRTDGQKGGWWNWKVEKVALEALFIIGDLMVARRQNFQRIYNLRQRVLPNWDDAQALSYGEVQKIQASKAVKALGVATPAWIADYFYTPQREIPAVVKDLVNEGELIEIEVEDWGKCYIHKENDKHVEPAEKMEPTLTTMLSPFDPLVNNRKRALTVFNFEYQIECYTPAPKRKYGYFTLPILHRGQLIGRLDPKAHRKEKIFEIKAIHLEPGVKMSDELLGEVAQTIQACAAWHQTAEVVVRTSKPKELTALLQKKF